MGLAFDGTSTLLLYSESAETLTSTRMIPRRPLEIADVRGEYRLMLHPGVCVSLSMSEQQEIRTLQDI